MPRKLSPEEVAKLGLAEPAPPTQGRRRVSPDEALALGLEGPKRHSAGESAVVGVGQGATLGFLDEIGGAIGKALLSSDRIEPGAAATQEMRDAAAARPSNYQLVRDRTRGAVEQARKDNPDEFMAGEIGGAILAPVPGGGATQGAKLLVRAGKAAGKGALLGGAYGLGSSNADLTKGQVGGAALDTGLGMLLGGVGGAVGQGVGEGVSKVAGAARGKLLKKATQKVSEADTKLDELASAKLIKDNASAAGELGTVAQQGNRVIENLMRQEAAGTLSPANAARVAKMKADGQWQQALDELAANNLDDLPGLLRERQSRKGVLEAMRANKQELFEAARKEVADPMAQIKPRLQRYAAPVGQALFGSVGGGALGLLAGGNPAEVGVLALAGAGMRPAVQATRRMLQHPATQRPVFSLLQKAAQAAPSSVDRGVRASRAAVAAGQDLEEALLPILAEDDERRRRRMMTEMLMEGR